MQKKYSKFFIYKWLKEDLFGEFTLYKSENLLSKKMLKKIWNYMTNNWRSTRRGLVSRRSILIKKEQQLLSYLLYRVRFRTELKAVVFIRSTISIRNLNKARKYWLASYIKNKSAIVFLDLFMKGWYNTISTNFKQSFTLKKYVVNSTKGRFFSRKRRATIKRKFINKFFEKKVRVNFYRKRFYSLRFKSRSPSIRRTPPITIISDRVGCLSKTMKSLVYLRSWNSFNRSVKWGLNKILKIPKTTFVYRKPIFIPRFHYAGVFRPKKSVVKKNERRPVLNFRLLQYFSLVETSADFKNLFKSYILSARRFSLPSLSRIEFQITTSIIRAGFLENGYVATNLAKRKVFLVNGLPVSSKSVLNLWDIITVAKPLWWLVYSRFMHFFSKLTHYNYLKLHNTKFLNSFVLRNLKKTTYFRRRYISRFVQKKMKLVSYRLPRVIRGFLGAKNYILALPPSYMEVSFKLFLIVLWRLVLNPNQVTKPLNLRATRSLLFNKKKSYYTPTQIDIKVGKT